MTVSELIERLEDHLEAHGDSEVRMMHQESWPFEYDIRGATDAEALAPWPAGEPEDDDEEEPEGFVPKDTDPEHGPVFYLVEGRQIGYGDARAWNLCS